MNIEYLLMFQGDMGKFRNFEELRFLLNLHILQPAQVAMSLQVYLAESAYSL